jgi:hypothetical protein
MDVLITYLVTAMIAWVPPRMNELPDASESHADVLARYESIARDAATVARDESESPVFDGPDARTRTALLMLSVASFESSYRRDVDLGIGQGIGDGGRSFCLMQVLVGRSKTREGWTGRELVSDRQKCFRAGLHILRASFGACHALPLVDRLSAYASGHCARDMYQSQSRVNRALGWWQGYKLAKS